MLDALICVAVYCSIGWFATWNVLVWTFEGFEQTENLLTFHGDCYIRLISGHHELGGRPGTLDPARTRTRRDPGPGGDPSCLGMCT